VAREAVGFDKGACGGLNLEFGNEDAEEAKEFEDGYVFMLAVWIEGGD
jgi:hypothetical protein